MLKFLYLLNDRVCSVMTFVRSRVMQQVGALLLCFFSGYSIAADAPPPPSLQNIPPPPLNQQTTSAPLTAQTSATPSLVTQQVTSTPPQPLTQQTNIPPPPLNQQMTAPPLSTPNNTIAFQDWLKKNGQTQAVPPPPFKEKIPPPPMARSKTIVSSMRTTTLMPPPMVDQPPMVISPPMTYVESQNLMLKTAPAGPPPSQDSIDAFNMMTQQNTPLTPQQVVRLRQIIDQSQRAAAIPANVPPKPVSSTLVVNLAPGATPPAIRLAQGYMSSLVFVDSTGTPWPIASYDIGDPKTANIQWDGKSNILLIQAVSPYGDSDMIIRLAGLPTPIALALVSGQRVVDYRTDIHVPGIGPNTKELPIGTGLPDSANQLLLSVLDGIAPPGSRPLTVKGGNCQAWLLGSTIFLRTRHTLLSPGWVGRMVSPDGMHAYEIQRSSSILVSQYGQPVEFKIEGL